MARKSILSFLLFIACGLFHPGCASEYDRMRVYPGHSVEKVWGGFVAVVNDYYDLEYHNDDERRLKTGWNKHLGTMYRMGRRFRVLGEVRRTEDSGHPAVLLTVEREVNTNMDRPLSSAEAQWSSGGADGDRADKILDRVYFNLNPIKPSGEILNPEPSLYGKSPPQRDRENIWGKKSGAKRDKDPDLWKRGR